MRSDTWHTKDCSFLIEALSSIQFLNIFGIIRILETIWMVSLRSDTWHTKDCWIEYKEEFSATNAASPCFQRCFLLLLAGGQLGGKAEVSATPLLPKNSQDFLPSLSSERGKVCCVENVRETQKFH